MRSIKSGLPEVLFEVADTEYGSLEYGVTATSYTAAIDATRDDPGDGPEVDLPAFVTIYANGVQVGHTTWDIFIMDLLLYRRGGPTVLTKGRLEMEVWDQVLRDTDEAVVESDDGPEWERDDYEPDFSRYDDEPEYEF